MSTSTGEYRHNHYVPEWYQRRFMLPGQSRYFRLDLKPDVVTSAGGHKYTRRDIHEWSPEKVFAEDDLYTTQWGPISNTEIERFFSASLMAMDRKRWITSAISSIRAPMARCFKHSCAI